MYPGERAINMTNARKTTDFVITSDNQRIGSASDDLDPLLSHLWNVICPCEKICGGCQIYVPGSIHPSKSTLSHKISTRLIIIIIIIGSSSSSSSSSSMDSRPSEMTRQATFLRAEPAFFS